MEVIGLEAIRNTPKMYPEEEDYDDIAKFTGLDILSHQHEKPKKVFQEKSSAGPCSRATSAKSSLASETTKKKVKNSKCSLIKIYTLLVGLFMVHIDNI